MGYKEASHFLRNIGHGISNAIIESHILRNMKDYGVIECLPLSPNRRIYLDIEKRMDVFDRVDYSQAPTRASPLMQEMGEIFK